MIPIRRRTPQRRLCAACILVIAGVVALPVPCADAAALPSYLLYYSFEIPLALPGLVISDEGTQKTYTGTLRGSLGGLPLRSATFTYGPGASNKVGGGTFSLATAAGAIRDGQILMATDGERTTLLFFGIYLGMRLEFSITSDREQVGGTSVVANGLARSGFAGHDEYSAAVRTAVVSLPPADRDQLIAKADTNPRLVSEYQQRLPPR